MTRDSQLDTLRTELDRVGHELMLYCEKRYHQHAPEFSVRMSTAGSVYRLADTQGFIVRLYQLIAPVMASSSLSRELEMTTPDSSGVKRIIAHSDFSDCGGSGVARDFAIIVFFLDFDNLHLQKILCDRFSIIEQVGMYKRKNGVEVRKIEREQQIIDTAENKAVEHGLPEGVMTVLYQRLLFPVAFEIEERIMELEG